MTQTIATKEKKGKKAAWAKKALASAALVAALISGLAAAPSADASTTFTVNSSGDGADTNVGGAAFDGVCRANGAGSTDLCTLRAAIQEANATPGADAINFGIFGTGVKTIKVNSNFNGVLPAITEAVTINGYTQPGASPNTSAKCTNAKLMIELDGENAGSVNGLNIKASNIVVKGLVINRFVHGDGISLSPFTSGNRIEGTIESKATS